MSTTQTVPWISPHPYVRIASIGSSNNKGVTGSLFFRCLNPLRGAAGSSTDPVKVQVYATFKGLELAGYSPDTETLSSISSSVKTRIAAQASLVKEASNKTDVFAGVSEAVSTVKGIIGSVTDAAAVAGDMISALGPIASLAALNKPTSVTSPQPVYHNLSNQLNYGTGVDVSTKLTITPGAAISTSPAILSTPDAQPKLIDVLMKPTLVSTWTFSAADTVDDWKVKYVLNPANTPKVITSTTRWPGGVYQPTYMGYYSRFFRYWRGSLKVMLTFRTSPNVQADFRVAHFPEIKNFVLPLEDYDGDIVSEIVGVRGDVTVTHTIPWISESHWKKCNSIASLQPADCIGILGISLASPIMTMGGAVDCEIYVNMYVSAGPDFDFMGHISDSNEDFIDPLATVLTTTNIRAQCDIHAEFKKPFPGIRPCTLNPEIGFINHEHINRITDLTKHYCDYVLVNNTADADKFLVTPMFYSANATAAQSNSIGRLVFPFLFWRGSMRVAYPTYSGDNAIPVFMTARDMGSTNNRDNYRAPFAWGPPPQVGTIHSAEIPWIRPRLHNELVPTHLVDEVVTWLSLPNNSTATPTLANAFNRLWMATGDDFSVGPLSACPPIGRSAAAAEPITELPPSLSSSISESTMNKIQEYLKGKGKLTQSSKEQ